jgi:hypothetical protein
VLVDGVLVVDREHTVDIAAVDAPAVLDEGMTDGVLGKEPVDVGNAHHRVS